MAAKPGAVDTARRFVGRRHPTAKAAFLGGSVMRGEGTSTSDLDLVIVDNSPPAPYRETSRFDGWIIEAFVHSPETLTAWSDEEAVNRRPVLAQLVTEGVVVADRGPAASIQAGMQQLLDRGPAPLTSGELESIRYGISDLSDDLVDGPGGLERISTVAALVNDVVRLELETAGQWSGKGKWIIRRLRRLDPQLAEELTGAAEAALTDPTALIALAEQRLDRHGGRLMQGYRQEGADRRADRPG